MPEHLAKAREKSREAERLKDAAAAEPRVEPKVAMLGLRKVGKGYEVVKYLAPRSDVELVKSADMLEYATQNLVIAMREMVTTV